MKGKVKLNLKKFIATQDKLKLAASLGVTYMTILNWSKGKILPEPNHAKKLVKLSRGKLDFNSIYR